MSDVAEQYAATRERTVELVRAVPAAEHERAVPSTPEWRVRDVLAHLAGNCADILSANLEGVATDPWTAAQVAARRDRTVEEIIAEWEELGPRVEAIIPAFPSGLDAQLVADEVTHEHDIRGALERPGGRDSGAVDIALQFFVGGLDQRLTHYGTPALELAAGRDQWVVGPGEPAARVAAEPFDFFRALIGRRSRDQILAFDWTGDPTAYVDRFSPFPLAGSDNV